MPASSRFLCIVLISFCATAQALERLYLASIEDSQWKLTANNTTLCRIEHQIPRFGSAVFSQQAGRDLRLELVNRRKFKQGINEEQTALNRMLNYLQVDNAVSEIVVTGHTDNTGLACYNEGLSERRAWYVYDLLIARGIDSSLLRVDYRG